MYDATDFGVSEYRSLDDLVDRWSADLDQHPLAHHASNLVVWADGDVVRGRSKGIGVGDGGRVGSVVYDDVFVRSADGWRIASRTARLRRPAPAAPREVSPIVERLDRIESRLAIGQLPIRYALAVDGRDLDAWVALFVPDVQVGREERGRAALRRQIEPLLRSFGRSVHQICGHRVDLDAADPDRATGTTYCRAEHEVGDRWIVMAIAYADGYRRVDGEWYFERRRERHWYAADVDAHPQRVGFDHWHGTVPQLPAAFETWDRFWSTSTET